MKSIVKTSSPKWIRSNDGILAGVCQGLGERLSIDPWMIRLGFIAALLLFGTGLLLYLILAISLPREDRLDTAYNGQLLGVCWNLSQKTGMEVGIIRAITLSLGFLSLGQVSIVYLILWLIWKPKPHDHSFSNMR